MNKLKTLVASTAIVVALAAPAFAQSKIQGAVLLEAHPTSNAQPGSLNFDSNRALFAAPVKLNELSYGSVSRIAPVEKWTTPTNIKASFIWSVKEDGKYALGAAVKNPWAHFWNVGKCATTFTINGQVVNKQPMSSFETGAAFGQPVDLKAGDYTVDATFACVREWILSPDVRDEKAPNEVAFFVKSDRGSRRLKADEVSIVVDDPEAAAAPVSATRVLRPGVKKDAPTLAEGAEGGLKAELRTIEFVGMFDNLGQAVQKKMSEEPQNAMLIPAGGVSLRALSKGETKAQITIVTLETNFLVKEAATKSTWLALVASDSGSDNRCWSQAWIEGKPLENSSLGDWATTNGAAIEHGAGIIGLFDVPATIPGAYGLKTIFVCKNITPEDAATELKIMIKRPGDKRLRPATPADFAVEKKGA